MEKRSGVSRSVVTGANAGSGRSNSGSGSSLDAPSASLINNVRNELPSILQNRGDSAGGGLGAGSRKLQSLGRIINSAVNGGGAGAGGSDSRESGANDPFEGGSRMGGGGGAHAMGSSSSSNNSSAGGGSAARNTGIARGSSRNLTGSDSSTTGVSGAGSVSRSRNGGESKSDRDRDRDREGENEREQHAKERRSGTATTTTANSTSTATTGSGSINTGANGKSNAGSSKTMQSAGSLNNNNNNNNNNSSNANYASAIRNSYSIVGSGTANGDDLAGNIGLRKILDEEKLRTKELTIKVCIFLFGYLLMLYVFSGVGCTSILFFFIFSSVLFCVWYVVGNFQGAQYGASSRVCDTFATIDRGPRRVLFTRAPFKSPAR
jgi:hypothetical protein